MTRPERTPAPLPTAPLVPASVADASTEEPSSEASAEVWVGVSTHLQADTAVSVRVHPEENRAVVFLGRYLSLTRLDLFADHAGLVRLRDLLADTIAELDTTRALRDTTGNDSTVNDSTERNPAA